jgi:membrane associated rhomboid family serine protease
MTGDSLDQRDAPIGREPAINAPWPPLAVAAVILILYALQSLAGDPNGPILRFAFIPADLGEGRWSGLFTALFVHGGWPHAFLNGLGALAFGAPVARLFGLDLRGVLAFFVFYLGAGALANIGFALVHPGSPVLVVGASGAVSALMGGASRLVDRRLAQESGGLAPFGSKTVIAMAVSWIGINAVMAVVGLGMVAADAPIAWEAHLAGYAVGLFAVGPLARLLGRSWAVERR